MYAAAVDCMRSCARVAADARWRPILTRDEEKSHDDSCPSSCDTSNASLAELDHVFSNNDAEIAQSNNSDTANVSDVTMPSPSRFKLLKDRLRRSMLFPRRLSEEGDNNAALALPLPIAAHLLRSHQTLALLHALHCANQLATSAPVPFLDSYFPLITTGWSFLRCLRK